MSTITISDDTVEIKSDEYMLRQFQQAMEAVSLGKKYSITGSRAYEGYELKELQAMYDYYETRVMAARGGIGSNVSDFSDGNLTAAGGG